MYTILAVGTLHLNRISPSRTRRFAEAYLWHHAITLYQSALCSKVTPQNISALLSACMFMGIVSICPENFKPRDSWVLTNKPEAMNWLCLQSGIRIILSMAKPFIDSSIWGTAFHQTRNEDAQCFESEIHQGREGLDPDLADLCGIDDCTTSETSPYYEPLRNLAAIFGLEKNLKNSSQFTNFMGKLENDFLALLRARDPPALLILAQWMGLMCSISHFQPWVEGRVRAECVAICMYLERSTDPRVIRLLRLPAAQFGYDLRARVPCYLTTT